MWSTYRGDVTLAVQGQMQRKTVAGLWEQGRHVSTLLAGLTEDDFRRPALPSGDVAALVAGLVVHESELLTALATSTGARPASLADHFLGDRVRRHARADLVRELTAHETGRALVAQFRQQLDEVHALLSEPTVAPVVSAAGQPLRTLDLVRLAAADLVLAADDLARSVPDSSLEWSRECLAAGVRALAEVITQHHPGRSIELRVPPYAAVQCGLGDDPVHTRGTPPNVVEVDPLTFVRLVHGRTRFGDEVAAGRVSASGSRSDLSAWFPVLG